MEDSENNYHLHLCFNVLSNVCAINLMPHKFEPITRHYLVVHKSSYLSHSAAYTSTVGICLVLIWNRTSMLITDP